MRIRLYRGWYYAVWREGGVTKRKALRTRDRDAAEQALADYRKALARAPETVGAIVDAYLEEKKAAASIANMKNAWNQAKGHFGSLRPDQVTREQCNEYTASRTAMGIQAGTIRKEIGTMRSALRWASCPPAGIALPPAPPPKDRHLTRDEFRRLMAAAGPLHLRTFIALAIATAGRATAILELTWNRVDFERGIITLATGEGGRKGRATVPMTRSVRSALVEAHRASVTPYVVEYADRRVLSVKKSFAAAVKAAKLKDVSPHVLRHTAAVWMAEGGVPMSQIAQYLGHGDSRITERVYARFSPDFLRSAAAALETDYDASGFTLLKGKTPDAS